MQTFIFAVFFSLMTAPGFAFAVGGVTVDPVANGRIYVGSADMPGGLHGMLTDIYCQAIGFASSDHSRNDVIELTKPEMFTVPVIMDDKPQLLHVELNPKYSPIISVITELSCIPK